MTLKNLKKLFLIINNLLGLIVFIFNSKNLNRILHLYCISFIVKNKSEFKNAPFFRRNELLGWVNNHFIRYPTPVNLNYFWAFGSLSGMALLIQIITGIFLAMHYVPHADMAFDSIEHIMRNVPYGWAIRYTHSNGASIFFIVVYIHISRTLFYGSFRYPRQYVWYSGLIIFILMMAIAFLGYVLPWGQMSFWGATVITNLFTAIPVVGVDISHFLWGGYSVDNPTLNRFFSLHYFLPFVLVGMVFIHLTLLHDVGSSNPLSADHGNYIPFYPYFFIKDFLAFQYMLIFYVILVCIYPNKLNHSDNYIPANPLVTPAHIVPEWYFLPFYAILRSIPDKLGGVLCMFSAIGILFFLPSVISPYKTDMLPPIFNPYTPMIDWGLLFDRTYYRRRLRVPVHNASLFLLSEANVWLFFVNFIFLGWIGSCPVKYPYVLCGQLATFIYFFCIFGYRLIVIFYMRSAIGDPYYEDVVWWDPHDKIDPEDPSPYLKKPSLQSIYYEDYLKKEEDPWYRSKTWSWRELLEFSRRFN